jgi:hypothetical protein
VIGDEDGWNIGEFSIFFDFQMDAIKPKYHGTPKEMSDPVYTFLRWEK